MKISKTRMLATGCLVTLLFLVAPAFAANLLPGDMVIEDSFKPGLGESVGQILLVQGRVVIIHADDAQKGYQAQKGQSLFNGDTLVSLDRGRVRYQLNDESVITMGSNTKQALSRSVYEPGVSRSTFLRMDIGKARFTVTKFTKMKRSEFRVKSPTAVVGVRGSEWDQEVTPTSTEVITHEDTTLEVLSVMAPDVEPTVLEDFERTMVMEGNLPTDVEPVDPAEIENLDREFEMGDNGEEVAQEEAEAEEEAAEEEAEAEEEAAQEEAEAEEEAAEEEAEAEEEAAEGEAGAPDEADTGDDATGSEDAGSEGIRVPEAEVVEPEQVTDEELAGEPPAGSVGRVGRRAGTPVITGGEDPGAIPDEVAEGNREDIIRAIIEAGGQIPDFPPVPE